MKGSKSNTLNMILRFADGSKRYFVLAVFAAVLSILFTFLMPQIVGLTVDSIIGDKNPELPAFLTGLYNRLGGRTFFRANFILCAAGVVAASALASVFGYFNRLGTAKGTERFIMKLRDTLFAHIQRLPFSWHTGNATGDIIQRCTYDVETAQRFISAQLIEVVRTMLLVTLALVIMFSMNAFMASITLAFTPFIIGYSVIFYTRVSTRFREADEAEGELLTHVQENLTGVRVVRAFGRERFETDKFDDINEKYIGKWISLGSILGVFWGIGDIVSSGELLVMTAVGALLSASGKITLGEFLIFLSYTTTLMWPIRQLGHILSEMSKTGVSLRRIQDILDTPLEDDETGAEKPPLDRDIVFEHVRFSYDAQPVLKDLNFTIKNGTTFGILGATGSGKSTITYLMNRLYDLPEEDGRITIGGVDIRKIDRQYLRRGVGLVLQEPFLYSKSVFENVDIAARSKDLAHVRKNAEIAAVDESIMAFTHGYETIVGERGVTLSGGQKQRVAIARTLMTHAPIMVFDDSMSSVDMETDAKIRQALRDNTAGATVVLISHRISTLMHADTILVLEDGRIAELGAHGDLLKKDGIYKRVYDLQSGLQE